MGLASASLSITRYHVDGKINTPLNETVAQGLRRNAVAEIDGDAVDKSVGWTSFSNPFLPNFEGHSFAFKELFIFALRIDRKSIPPKLLKKHLALETSKRLAKTHQRFLSKDEKQALKDKVTNDLTLRLPPTPNVYDVAWYYERALLYFFSNLRQANEELETLFKRSFHLSLIRMFPFTAAEIRSDLSDRQRDILSGLSPTDFSV
jgi:DNA recombination-dependent growth factor C